MNGRAGHLDPRFANVRENLRDDDTVYIQTGWRSRHELGVNSRAPLVLVRELPSFCRECNWLSKSLDACRDNRHARFLIASQNDRLLRNSIVNGLGGVICNANRSVRDGGSRV